ncbi:hypothetical protein BGX28_009034 [Mortierella sp. GBA30]|nr:hypothetical protein BGX28_009034 [Mortierella sp. GBA30]
MLSARLFFLTLMSFVVLVVYPMAAESTAMAPAAPPVTPPAEVDAQWDDDCDDDDDDDDDNNDNDNGNKGGDKHNKGSDKYQKCLSVCYGHVDYFLPQCKGHHHGGDDSKDDAGMDAAGRVNAQWDSEKPNWDKICDLTNKICARHCGAMDGDWKQWCGSSDP